MPRETCPKIPAKKDLAKKDLPNKTCQKIPAKKYPAKKDPPQQGLMRNLVGQQGVSVSLHGDGDRVIIDGSGTGGIDPAYMTLANDEITMHKDVVAGAVGATSLAIGAGGSIMCVGNITAAC